MRTRSQKLLIVGAALLATAAVAFAVCVPRLREEPVGYFAGTPLSTHSDDDVFIFLNGTVQLETCCGSQGFGTYKRTADGRWLWHVHGPGWKGSLVFEISPGALYMDAKCVDGKIDPFRLRRTLWRPNASVSSERPQLTPVNESAPTSAESAPSEPSSVAEPRPEPEEQVSSFFKTWKEKGGSLAIQELTKGTLFASQKRAQLEAYIKRLQVVTGMYGKVSRVESVEKVLFGESFMRLRMISYHPSGGVVFWEFMFARSESDWRIHSLRFNDDFYRAFGDVPSRQPPNQQPPDGIEKE